MSINNSVDSTSINDLTSKTHRAYPAKGTPTGNRARREQQEHFQELLGRVHDMNQVRAERARNQVNQELRKLSNRSGNPAVQAQVKELEEQRDQLNKQLLAATGNLPLQAMQHFFAATASRYRTLDELLSDLSGSLRYVNRYTRSALAGSLIIVFAAMNPAVTELYNQWVKQNRKKDTLPFNCLPDGTVIFDYRPVTEADPVCVVAQAYRQLLVKHLEDANAQHKLELAPDTALDDALVNQVIDPDYVANISRIMDPMFNKKLESLLFNDPEPYANAMFDLLKLAGLVVVNGKLVLCSHDGGLSINLGLKKLTKNMVHWMEFRKGRLPMNRIVKILNNRLGVGDDDDDDDDDEDTFSVTDPLVGVNGHYLDGCEEVTPSIENASTAIMIDTSAEYRDDIETVLDTFTLDGVRNRRLKEAYRLINKVADSLSDGHAEHLQAAMSLALYRRNRSKYPYLVTLWGPGGTGKSTLIKWLCKAVGDRNTVATPLDELARDRQLQMNLRNAAVYAMPEMPAFIEAKCDNLVKKLTSGDTISGRELNSKRQVQFQANMLVIGATNYAYRVDRAVADKSALRRRVLPFRGRDVKLTELLSPEEQDICFNNEALMAAAMLVWLIIGMRVLEEDHPDGLQGEDWMQSNIDGYLGDINQVDNITKKGTIDDRLSLDGQTVPQARRTVNRSARVNGEGGALSESSVAKEISNSTEYEIITQTVDMDETFINEQSDGNENEYYSLLKESKAGERVKQTRATVVRLKDEALKGFTLEQLEGYPQLIERFKVLMSTEA